MTTPTVKYLETHLMVALALLTVALGIAGGAYVAHLRIERAESLVREELTRIGETMYAIAETTDRNGIDESAAGIITNCERRGEFDALLTNLGTLGKKDLITVQSMFDACGRVDAKQKAFMVSRLTREHEEYEDLLHLLAKLSGQGVDAYHDDAWTRIVETERLRSDLLADLSTIQANIISNLILGKGTGSAEVREQVAEAQNIGQRLIVYDRTIDELRASVKP
ncbi:MAG TPA: hypothetical protein VFS75_02380 [Candidatus Paceibacterota bacterium]|nr:hypothetical protein [Candidatus Paceibacterota bacterium]